MSQLFTLFHNFYIVQSSWMVWTNKNKPMSSRGLEGCQLLWLRLQSHVAAPDGDTPSCCRSCRARLQRHNARRRKKADADSPAVKSSSAVRKSSGGSSRRGSATSVAAATPPEERIGGAAEGCPSSAATGLQPMALGSSFDGVAGIPGLLPGWGPLMPGQNSLGAGGALAAADLLMQQPLPGTLPALGSMRSSAGDGRPHRPSFDSSGSSYDAGAVPLPLAGHGHGGSLPARAGDHAALRSGPPPNFTDGGPGGGDCGLPGPRSGGHLGSGGGGRSTDQRLFVADGARNASSQSTNSVYEPASASQLDAILKSGAGGGGREGAVPNAPGSGSAGGAVPSVLDEARVLLAFGGYQQPYSSDQQLVRFSAKCRPAAARLTC